eukprot:CAMPEP_0194394554 /NCGR_PEP_ID=MMETSP0174-20130528/123919_1 /TAXON_ID=216777 /ORGANISM="Proboscia alata, Strain PI-D3" /LENGTH=629 /DNA_ID=CAMNT_0039190365 /DNA_START=52 /DNA_END=1941 /DNA_ORIENTATION=+
MTETRTKTKTKPGRNGTICDLSAVPILPKAKEAKKQGGNRNYFIESATMTEICIRMETATNNLPTDKKHLPRSFIETIVNEHQEQNHEFVTHDNITRAFTQYKRKKQTVAEIEEAETKINKANKQRGNRKDGSKSRIMTEICIRMETATSNLPTDKEHQEQNHDFVTKHSITSAFNRYKKKKRKILAAIEEAEAKANKAKKQRENREDGTESRIMTEICIQMETANNNIHPDKMNLPRGFIANIVEEHQEQNHDFVTHDSITGAFDRYKRKRQTVAEIEEVQTKTNKANKERGNRKDGDRSWIMTAICVRMEMAYNNIPPGKKNLPHGFIARIIKEHQEQNHEFVTLHSISSAFTRYKEKTKAETKTSKANKQRGNRKDGSKSRIMTEICIRMETAYNNLPPDKKYLPHNFISNMVKEHQEQNHEFVTLHSISSAFTRYKEKTKAETKTSKANKQRGNRKDGSKSRIMTEICIRMETAYNNLPPDKKYLPHNFISNMVKEHQEQNHEFVTRYSIKSAFNRYKKKKKQTLAAIEVDETAAIEEAETKINQAAKSKIMAKIFIRMETARNNLPPGQNNLPHKFISNIVKEHQEQHHNYFVTHHNISSAFTRYKKKRKILAAIEEGKIMAEL